MAEYPIPEDLKKRYAILGGYMPMECAVTDIYVREYQLLIERIAKLEAENTELKATVERLSRPVSDEELEPLHDKYGWFRFGDAQGDKTRDFSNALIAARLAEATSVAPKEPSTR